MNILTKTDPMKKDSKFHRFWETNRNPITMGHKHDEAIHKSRKKENNYKKFWKDSNK